MKRFTETTKWSDPWYRRLSERSKLLWGYLTDNCNSIGLIDLDFEAASFHIGGPVEERHLTELGDRIQRLKDGKIFIPKFIDFQYGDLSETCPAHKPVLKLVRIHKIVKSEIGYKYPTECLALEYPILTGKGKEKDKDKDKEEGVKGESLKLEVEPVVVQSDESRVIQFLNETSGRAFRNTDSNLTFVRERLSEPGVTLDGVKTMIVRQWKRWKGSPMEEYIRPETLFNKTKFDGYYAAKDQPIHENSQVNPKPNPRNTGVVGDLAEISRKTAEVVARRQQERETNESL